MPINFAMPSIISKALPDTENSDVKSKLLPCELHNDENN